MAEKLTTHCQHANHSPLTWCGIAISEIEADGPATYDSWEVTNCLNCLRAYIAWLRAIKVRVDQ